MANSRYKVKVIMEIGYRYLSGERLKRLSEDYQIPYRVLRYHSAKTEFYIPNFKVLKQKKADAILMFKGQRIPMTRKFINMGGRGSWMWMADGPY